MIWWVSAHKLVSNIDWGQHTRFSPGDKRMTITPKRSQEQEGKSLKLLNIFHLSDLPGHYIKKAYILSNRKFLLMRLNVEKYLNSVNTPISINSRIAWPTHTGYVPEHWHVTFSDSSILAQFSSLDLSHREGSRSAPTEKWEFPTYHAVLHGIGPHSNAERRFALALKDVCVCFA